MVSKGLGKFSKLILFLQDNFASHNAAIMHQKLADLHFEILIWPLQTTTSFLTSRNTSREEGCFAAQLKEMLLDGLKELEQ
jgi:hypothetical protein